MNKDQKLKWSHKREVEGNSLNWENFMNEQQVPIQLAKFEEQLIVNVKINYTILMTASSETFAVAWVST